LELADSTRQKRGMWVGDFEPMENRG